MKNSIIKDIAATLLLMMFLYAGFSKYFDYLAFQRGMHNQPFPSWMSSILVILIPVVEISTALLLLLERSRDKGLQASVLLMSLFTAYVAAILLHLFRHVPCICGGLIKSMSWTTHLIFNLFFLSLSILALRLGKQSNGKPSYSTMDNPPDKNISRAKSG